MASRPWSSQPQGIIPQLLQAIKYEVISDGQWKEYLIDMDNYFGAKLLVNRFVWLCLVDTECSQHGEISATKCENQNYLWLSAHLTNFFSLVRKIFLLFSANFCSNFSFLGLGGSGCPAVTCFTTGEFINQWIIKWIEIKIIFSQQVARPQQRLRAELRLLLRQGERELSVRHVSALHLLQTQGEETALIHRHLCLCTPKHWLTFTYPRHSTYTCN